MLPSACSPLLGQLWSLHPAASRDMRSAVTYCVLLRRPPPVLGPWTTNQSCWPLQLQAYLFFTHSVVAAGNITRTPLVVRRVPCVFRLPQMHRHVPPSPPEMGHGLAVGTVATPSPGSGERGDRSDPHERAWVCWVRWVWSPRLLTLTGFRMMDRRSGAPDIRRRDSRESLSLVVVEWLHDALCLDHQAI